MKKTHSSISEAEQPLLHLLHHALGITNPFYTGEPYRNHFVAGPGHADYENLLRLCQRGWMRPGKPVPEDGGPEDLPLAIEAGLFQVTESGHEVAMATRPRATRGQLRYRAYLNLLEAGEEVSFHTFLTDPDYQEVR